MPIAPLGREGVSCCWKGYGMKKFSFLPLLVIVLLLVPALVFAQGLFGIGLPLIPNWGGMLSGPSGCCDPGLKCCPSVYVGYEIGQGRDRKPLASSLDLANFYEQVNTHFSDPGGLWLGVSNYCQCSDRVGILLSGWYLFPSTGDAQETYSTGLSNPLFGSPSVTARTWSTTRSWGWIDGAFVLGSPCGLNLIAGFRWDSFSIKLQNPGPVTPLTVLPIGTTSDEANLTMNSYIPLIGTQACWGGPCCGLLVRVWGFPWVPGNLTYGETGILGAGTRLKVEGNYDRAYFLEVFSEYSRPCPGSCCLGVWARWNYLYAHTNSNPAVPGFIINEGPIRSTWAIGGKVTLNFDLPRPL